MTLVRRAYCSLTFFVALSALSGTAFSTQQLQARQPQPSSPSQSPQAQPAQHSAAPLPLVTKQVFTLPSYTTVGGQEIRNVRVGYETYGKLNDTGDNAIFVAQFFVIGINGNGGQQPPAMRERTGRKGRMTLR